MKHKYHAQVFEDQILIIVHGRLITHGHIDTLPLVHLGRTDVLL